MFWNSYVLLRSYLRAPHFGGGRQRGHAYSKSAGHTPKQSGAPHGALLTELVLARTRYSFESQSLEGKEQIGEEEAPHNMAGRLRPKEVVVKGP